jgi:hypothetical protein
LTPPNKVQGFSISPPKSLKKIAWPDPKVTVMFRDEANGSNLHVRMLPLPPGAKAGPQFAELIDSFKDNPSKAGQGELKVGDKTVP